MVAINSSGLGPLVSGLSALFNAGFNVLATPSPTNNQKILDQVEAIDVALAKDAQVTGALEKPGQSAATAAATSEQKFTVRENQIRNYLEKNSQLVGDDQIKLLTQLSLAPPTRRDGILNTINANDGQQMRAYGQAVAGAGASVATGMETQRRKDQERAMHEDKLKQLAKQTNEIRESARNSAKT